MDELYAVQSRQTPRGGPLVLRDLNWMQRWAARQWRKFVKAVPDPAAKLEERQARLDLLYALEVPDAVIENELRCMLWLEDRMFDGDEKVRLEYMAVAIESRKLTDEQQEVVDKLGLKVGAVLPWPW